MKSISCIKGRQGTTDKKDQKSVEALIMRIALLLFPPPNHIKIKQLTKPIAAKPPANKKANHLSYFCSPPYREVRCIVFEKCLATVFSLLPLHPSYYARMCPNTFFLRLVICENCNVCYILAAFDT